MSLCEQRAAHLKRDLEKRMFELKDRLITYGSVSLPKNDSNLYYLQLDGFVYLYFTKEELNSLPKEINKEYKVITHTSVTGFFRKKREHTTEEVLLTLDCEC